MRIQCTYGANVLRSTANEGRLASLTKPQQIGSLAISAGFFGYHLLLKSWAKNKGRAVDGLQPVVDFDSKKSLKSNGSNLTCSMGRMPDDSKTTTTTTACNRLNVDAIKMV